MPKLYICTAGTSILKDVPAEISSDEEYHYFVKKRIDKYPDISESLTKLSAETNSLQALGLCKDDKVTFIVSDTDLCRICANELEKVVSKYFECKTDSRIIKGLQVEDAKLFRTRGISNLYEQIGILREKHSFETVLNVTGGFKSVVPFMALYGLLYGIDVVYLFQFSSVIIHLPPAPLGVDFEKAGKLRKFLIKLRSEEILPKREFERAVSNVPFHERAWFQSLICEEEGMVYLSAFGQIIVETAREKTILVHISKNASRKLNDFSGDSEKRLHGILSKLGDPLWRNSHIDPGWYGTDLIVAKPGNVAERAAYYIKGDKVFVCELYVDHDVYEKELSSHSIKDYKKGEFTQYIAPVAGYSQEESQPISSDIESILEDNSDLKDECTDLKRQLEYQENKWIELDDKNEELEKKLSSLEREQKDRIKLINDLNNSFSKRLKFLFTGKLPE